MPDAQGPQTREFLVCKQERNSGPKSDWFWPVCIFHSRYSLLPSSVCHCASSLHQSLLMMSPCWQWSLECGGLSYLFWCLYISYSYFDVLILNLYRRTIHWDCRKPLLHGSRGAKEELRPRSWCLECRSDSLHSSLWRPSILGRLVLYLKWGMLTVSCLYMLKV